jgi:hypothetical protein
MVEYGMPMGILLGLALILPARARAQTTPSRLSLEAAAAAPDAAFDGSRRPAGGVEAFDGDTLVRPTLAAEPDSLESGSLDSGSLNAARRAPPRPARARDESWWPEIFRDAAFVGAVTGAIGLVCGLGLGGTPGLLLGLGLFAGGILLGALIGVIYSAVRN